MSDAQFQKIAGFIAGLETALIHIGNVLERQGVTTRADLAAGFRETAGRYAGAGARRAR